MVFSGALTSKQETGSSSTVESSRKTSERKAITSHECATTGWRGNRHGPVFGFLSLDFLSCKLSWKRDYVWTDDMIPGHVGERSSPGIHPSLNLFSKDVSPAAQGLSLSFPAGRLNVETIFASQRRVSIYLISFPFKRCVRWTNMKEDR